MKKKKKLDKPDFDENPAKRICPFCSSPETSPIDPKKIMDKKSFHICLVCGQSFEYINRKE